MILASRIFGCVQKRSVLVFSVLLSLLATPAIAQQQVEKLTDIQWTEGTLVYQKGNWIPEGTLRVLNTFLAQQEMPITLVIADTVEDEVFRLPDGQVVHGFDAADFAVGTHGLMKQPAFRAQVDESTGKPNGSVLFVSPERVRQLDGARPWQFYSSAYLDDLGLSWQRVWKGGLEDVGIPYLKDGEIDQEVIRSVEAYHNKVDAHFRAVAFWRGFWRLFPWALGLIALLVTALVLIIKHRNATDAKAKAQRELQVWVTALAGKGVLLRELNQRKTKVFGAKRADLTVEGEDLELANGAIEKIGRARLLLNLATNTVARVQGLLNRSFAGFSTAPYEEAMRILERPLEFDPEENVEAALTGNQIEEAEYLWAPISSFRPFKTSFQVMIDTFNKITKEASEALDTFNNNRSEVVQNLGAVNTRLAAFDTRIGEIESLMGADELAALAIVRKEVIPGLTNEAKQVSGRALKSPTTHLHHVRGLTGRIEEAESCAAALLTLLRNRPAMQERIAALEAQGDLKVDWLRSHGANCVGALIDVIDSLDSDKPDLSGNARTAAEAFPGIISRVETLNKRRTLEVAEHERLKLRLQTLRGQLSAELGIAAERLFTESGDDDSDHRAPDEALADAGKQLKAARALLCQGRLEEAEQQINLADAGDLDAESDISMWLSVKETYAQRRLAIGSRAAELEGDIGAARRLLEELGEFDQAALQFRAGDPTNPRSNGTVADNIQEIEHALTERASSLANAATAFEGGTLLAAGDWLTHAENWNQFIANRVAEIRHKHGTVMGVDRSNAEKLPLLLKGLKHQVDTPYDHHVRQATIDSLAQAHGELAEANRRHGGESRNPFEIAEVIARASGVASRFAQSVQRDLALFEEAQASAGKAQTQLTELDQLLASMSDDEDDLPDADAFDRAESEIDSLQSQLRRCQAELRTPHTDWAALDGRIDQIYNRTTTLLLALRREKEDGEAALTAISQARTKVREAGSWSGTYVSSISGSSGKAALERADDAFEQGDFTTARQEAASALSQAANAISAAEDADQKERRRVKQQQQAAARRREEAQRASYSSSYSRSRSSPSSFSFSSGGGGGGFRGGFSSGGGGKGW